MLKDIYSADPACINEFFMDTGYKMNNLHFENVSQLI